MRGEDVKKILEKNGHLLSEVAKKLDISPQNFNNWLGVQDVKTGILEKIAKAIDKNMYFFLENESVKNEEPEGFPEGVIRYYNIDSTTNLAEMFKPNSGVKFEKIIIPGYGDCCIALNVWGKSMEPALKNGEIIICRECENNFIEYGYMYLILTKENHRMIKYIQPGSSDSKINCLSENKFYHPIEIDKSEIFKLFVIKGHIEQVTF